MRISINWLREYVDINDLTVEELAEKITKAGVNVEKIEKKAIKNLTIGKVLECQDHPDSDHLKVCQVDVGSQILQIICGASNVAKGQKVIVAKEGAFLPGEFLISKTKIRGIESCGMICALFELGLEDKTENYDKGIHVLEDDALIGGNPLEYLDADDVMFELDLNPNRSDCTNHLGFAYEVATILDREVTLPDLEIHEIEQSAQDELKIKINTDKCPLYMAKIIKNVEIKESPNFIKKRLQACGIRSINNLVDISNYVMLEYGQPLHFFDADKLNKEIIVRLADNKEEIVTLDKKLQTLQANDIVISDQKEAIAIAGVMGGLNSSVDENTKNIIVESALFDAYSVRYTSLRLDLRSEASLRFEKPLNYEYTKQALLRACHLLEKYAAGEVLKDEVMVDNLVKETKVIEISQSEINGLLGMNLDINEISSIFKRLGYKTKESNNIFTVQVPNRALDIKLKADLIEEIGRIYGYDNIVGKLPLQPIKTGGYQPKIAFRKDVSKRMRSLGLDEIRTYTLINDEDALLFGQEKESLIKILSPMSSDRTTLRKSLLPSLLKVNEYNLSRQVKDINIYEISNVYYEENNIYHEELKLGLVMSGNYSENLWQGKKIEVDFYLIKGVIENLLEYLGFNGRYSFKADALTKEFNPYMGAKVLIDNQEIGFIGCIHPNLSKNQLYLGEISLEKIFKIKSPEFKYYEICKFPNIVKDAAFIFDKNITADSIIETIRKLDQRILKDIQIFDYYQGDKLAEDKKSIALSFIFEDNQKTLTDEEVMIVFNEIINIVTEQLKGELRNK